MFRVADRKENKTLQLPDEKIAIRIQIFSWESRDGLIQTQATLSCVLGSSPVGRPEGHLKRDLSILKSQDGLPG